MANQTPLQTLSSDTVDRAIKRLISLKLEHTTTSKLIDELTPLFRGFRIAAFKFAPGLYIYRGRTCQKPTHIAELGCPPAAKAALGRANDVGESIFYSGSAKSVPFFEIKPKIGDCVALSVWKTTSALCLTHAGYSPSVTMSLNSRRELGVAHSFVDETRSASLLNSKVYDFLADCFAARAHSESAQYKLTAAIAKKMLAGKLLDGLIYPSIRMDGLADNVALKSEVASRSLRLVSVEFLEVKALSDGQFDVAVLDSAPGTDEDGRLRWAGRPLRWVLERPGDELTLKCVNDDWVAFNKCGQRVDPQ